ncbi:hypothetical protein E4T56_gene79, partial [Termitomyces sp. T112]
SAPPVNLHGQSRNTVVTSSFQPPGLTSSSGSFLNAHVSTNPLPRHSSVWQTTPNHNLPNSLQAVSSANYHQKNRSTRNFAPFDQRSDATGHPGGSRYLGNGNI